MSTNALRTPETVPGEFIAVIKGVDLKVVADHRLQLPPNARAQVRRVDVLNRTVTGLSAGATVTLVERDPNFPEAAVAASVSTNLTGDNNDLTFTAVAPGAAGNSITVEYVDPGANDAELSVDVTGNAITVNLATDETGEITSTAADILAAIEGSAAASALVTVTDKAGNDGTGVVTELAETNLSGGKDRFQGETVQAIVASGDLADSGTAGGFETLTVTGGLLREFSQLQFSVTAGATATAQIADVVVTGLLL